MKHSSIQLRVLLHHHYSPANWSEEQPHSPAAGEATDYWMKNGCLEEIDNSGRDSGFQLTARGEAMVKAWLDQPLPPVKLKVVPAAPQAVIEALAHVRQFLPDIDRVVYAQDGKWEYSERGEWNGIWPAGIELDILEAGADAVDGYPAVFEVQED